MKKEDKILVIDARLRPNARTKSLLKKSSVISVVKSASLRREWINRADSELSVEDITRQINEQATNLRQDFEKALETIANYKNLFWHATRTAEKNTLINPLFEDAILVHLILSHNFQKPNKVLVTDNPELILFFKDIKDRFKIKYWLKVKLKPFFRQIEIQMLFILWFCGNRMASLLLPRIHSEILIHTFLDSETMKSSKYRERYFPDLKEFYEERNISVSHLVSGAGNYPLRIFRTMNLQGFRVFNEFKIYETRDLFFIISTVSKLRKLNAKSFMVGGIELRKLIFIIHLQFGLDLDVYKHILRFRLGQRLGGIPNAPKVLVTEFEGMIPEKMLNAGIHSSTAKLKTFGYQHGAMFENQLCNYPTQREIDLGLVSDKIVCNGEIFRQLMKSRGIPDKMLEVGSALRLKYLHQNLNSNNNPSQKDLLVLLPMPMPDCLELIGVVEEAISDLNLQAAFKPHPMHDILLLAEHLNLKKHSIVNGMLEDLIFDYKVIAGMTTGALLEAGLLGLNVIRIQRQLSLDFDSTFMNPEIRIQVNNSKEFRFALTQFSKKSFEGNNRSALLLKNEYFASITPEGMNAFLP
jgi:hypothetical protein